MNRNAVNLKEKLNLFSDTFSPKTIARMNSIDFKLVKFEGEFVWHSHTDTDETFYVIEGEMRIDFRDGSVNLKSGDLYVVPKNVEHKPVAESPCNILLIEPAGTINTGNAGGDLTARNEMWI